MLPNGGGTEGGFRATAAVPVTKKSYNTTHIPRKEREGGELDNEYQERGGGKGKCKQGSRRMYGAAFLPTPRVAE